jgi:hypothetical protein
MVDDSGNARNRRERHERRHGNGESADRGEGFVGLDTRTLAEISSS